MSRWIGTLRVPVRSWKIQAITFIMLERGPYNSLEPLVSQVKYIFKNTTQAVDLGTAR